LSPLVPGRAPARGHCHTTGDKVPRHVCLPSYCASGWPPWLGWIQKCGPPRSLKRRLWPTTRRPVSPPRALPSSCPCMLPSTSSSMPTFPACPTRSVTTCWPLPIVCRSVISYTKVARRGAPHTSNSDRYAKGKGYTQPWICPGAIPWLLARHGCTHPGAKGTHSHGFVQGQFPGCLPDTGAHTRVSDTLDLLGAGVPRPKASMGAAPDITGPCSGSASHRGVALGMGLKPVRRRSPT
jgi:hypothetical protein